MKTILQWSSILLAGLLSVFVTGDWLGVAEALDRSVVYIPAGEFLMGSNSGRADERPERLVYLDAFEIDRYEVTNKWVSDWYNWRGYEDLPARNPQVLGPPWNRCVRGTAWYDPFGSQGWAQKMSRCSARNSSHETQDPRVGFRCARSVSR